MRQPQMRSPLEKGAAKGRDRLPRRGRTLQNGKDMGQHAPQPKFESRLLLFPVYEALKVKQVLKVLKVLKVQKVHRFPVFREYRIF